MPGIDLTQPSEQQTRWSIFLGIMLWFLHLNTLNALTSLSCKWGWFPFKIAGLSGLQFVEALISLVVMLMMLAIIFLGWRDWRRFQPKKLIGSPRMLQNTEKDRRPLVAFIAMLLNSFLLLFVIASFVPIFVLNACR